MGILSFSLIIHPKSSPIILFLILCQFANAQNGSFSGFITDDKTGKPLFGATISIEGTGLGTATDDLGYYFLENIPPKTYNINASYLGFLTETKYNIIIRSEGNIDINFKLTESTFKIEELVISPNPFDKLRETPLSIQKLSQDEISSYPGGNNDIAKVVQTLPGVSGSIGGFRNDIIIRGGAPNENVYYLDEVEIPNINHFATQGSAGGPVGLLNVSFFEGVTLSSSSFGAQYDNVLSGVLQFDQRNGNERDFRGNFRLGASESALTLEGPLFKKDKEKSKTTFIASVRRSYLQFLFQLIGLPIRPDYWDFQYKLNHKINDYNEIIFTGLGSIDDFSVAELDDFDKEQQAIQDQVPVIKQKTNSGGIIWKRRFKDNSGLLQTTISTNILRNRFFQFENNLNQSTILFENDSKEQELKFKVKLTKFQKNWTHKYGISLQNANYINKTNDVINNYFYDTDLNFVKYGFFYQGSSRFIRDKLGISVGLRVDGNTLTTEGNEILKTLSPRVAVNYKLNESGEWTINFAVGRYFKIPPYTILGFKNSDQNFENKDISYIRNEHFVIGIEHLLNKSSRITIEGFAKYYNNYPVSTNDGISLANKGGTFEVLGNEPVESIGKGRAYGIEFLYQQKFFRNFYAIASYTLYKSEFSGFDPTKFIPSAWDNNHLVSLSGGYKMKKNWEFSLRFRYLGGAPFPPIDETATLDAYPLIIRDFSRFGEVRLSPFSQLDIRIDKKWNFKKLSLDVYIDVQNLLKTKTPEEPLFGLSRDEEGIITLPRELELLNFDSEGQIIPSIGLVVNF